MAAPGGSAHGRLHAALARQPTSKRKGSARLLRLPSPTASCRPSIGACGGQWQSIDL